MISHTFDNHKNEVRDIKFYDGESNLRRMKLMISASFDGSIVAISLMEMQKVLKLNLNNVNQQIKKMVILYEEDKILLNIHGS